MKLLYIIGNGFDIHHNIPSKYANYREWLEDNDSELIENLRNFYDVDDKEWWNQFELELGHPDMSEYIDNIAFENEPDYGSDDFRDRDYHAGEFQAESDIGKLVADIKNTFTDWVGSLPAPNSGKKINLDKDDAFFISFNYTDTLQTLYNVKPKNIFFIHGNVGFGTELILGHNRPYDEIDADLTPEIPTPPDDLSDEELAEWYDEMADAGEDYIHQSVRGEVVSQIHRLRKNTDNSEEYIMPVLMSKDKKDLIVTCSCRCGQSFHITVDDEDKDKAESYFYQKGIKDEMVSYVKLNDMLLVKQAELQFK